MIKCPEHDASEPGSPLDIWFIPALGREPAEREVQCLERMLRNVFGYYLLQVGGGTRSYRTPRERADRLAKRGTPNGRFVVSFSGSGKFSNDRCQLRIYCH